MQSRSGLSVAILFELLEEGDAWLIGPCSSLARALTDHTITKTASGWTVYSSADGADISWSSEIAGVFLSEGSFADDSHGRDYHAAGIVTKCHTLQNSSNL